MGDDFLNDQQKQELDRKLMPGLIERYAHHLRAVLGKDTDRARELYHALLGKILCGHKQMA